MDITNGDSEQDSSVDIAYIREAWSDIRSYQSNIWQVTAIGLAGIAVVLDTIFRLEGSSDILAVLLLLAFAFVIISVCAHSVEWLRRRISQKWILMKTYESELKKKVDMKQSVL